MRRGVRSRPPLADCAREWTAIKVQGSGAGDERRGEACGVSSEEGGKRGNGRVSIIRPETVESFQEPSMRRILLAQPREASRMQRVLLARRVAGKPRTRRRGQDDGELFQRFSKKHRDGRRRVGSRRSTKSTTGCVCTDHTTIIFFERIPS